MDPLVALDLQLRLEGKEIFNGLIRQVEVVPDEDVPLMLMVQLANGKGIAYYDEALSINIQQELAAGCIEIEFPNIVPLLDILRTHGIGYEVEHYKTYVFPSFPEKDPAVSCLSKEDPKVIAFGFDGLGRQVFAMEWNHRLVSACVSTRENDRCGEAWVYTAPDYRHQGFAQAVVNAWAGSLLEAGKVPFYSHKLENSASGNLAKKLGLQPIFEEMSISQISK